MSCADKMMYPTLKGVFQSVVVLATVFLVLTFPLLAKSPIVNEHDH